MQQNFGSVNTIPCGTEVYMGVAGVASLVSSYYMWNKPKNSNVLCFTIMSGGDGGQSGNYKIVGSAGTSGGGGAGSSFMNVVINSRFVSSPFYFTVGEGGKGADPSSTAAIKNGVAGGDTFLYLYRPGASPSSLCQFASPGVALNTIAFPNIAISYLDQAGLGSTAGVIGADGGNIVTGAWGGQKSAPSGNSGGAAGGSTTAANAFKVGGGFTNYYPDRDIYPQMSVSNDGENGLLGFNPIIQRNSTMPFLPGGGGGGCSSILGDGGKGGNGGVGAGGGGGGSTSFLGSSGGGGGAGGPGFLMISYW